MVDLTAIDEQISSRYPRAPSLTPRNYQCPPKAWRDPGKSSEPKQNTSRISQVFCIARINYL